MKGLENSFVIEVRIVKNIFFNLLFRNFIYVFPYMGIFLLYQINIWVLKSVELN